MCAFCSASDFAYCDTFLRSVVRRPSHACTLLEPFGGLTCHLANTLVESNGTPRQVWGYVWFIRQQHRSVILSLIKWLITCYASKRNILPEIKRCYPRFKSPMLGIRRAIKDHQLQLGLLLIIISVITWQATQSIWSRFISATKRRTPAKNGSRWMAKVIETAMPNYSVGRKN